MSTLVRFTVGTAFTTIALPFFLDWARDEAEKQIDRMQEAVHFTPGAESPITAEVVVGGIGLTAGHFIVARVLGLRFGAALLSLFMAAVIGGSIFIYRAVGDER
ncbi:MAG: hypothetical protein H3C34_03830 [Caldilineaceae bacterium]|nr:hypothetical protein [Caldilineaceae bacterium]